MNKAVKTICFIAAGLIAVGLAMSCFGLFMGGSLGFPGLFGLHWGGDWNDHEEALQETYDKNWTTGGEVTEAFHTVELFVSDQSVQILQGDHFSVEYGYDEEYSKMQHHLKDGILTVEETDYDDSRVFWSLFGDNRRTGSVTITYPQGTKFEKVKIVGDLAEIRINDLAAQTLDIDTDLGDIAVNKIDVQKLLISTGAGDVKLKGVTCKDAELSCELGSLGAENFVSDGKLKVDMSAGDIHLQGDITGTAELYNELGDMKIVLTRPQSEYSYRLDTELGDISVNGKATSERTSVSGGANHLEIGGSAGDIDVRFH